MIINVCLCNALRQILYSSTREIHKREIHTERSDLLRLRLFYDQSPSAFVKQN